MPKGKGTYGSQVGRPSKKDKYEYGGKVDPFSTKNPEGLPAQQTSEAMDKKNMVDKGIPITNAQDRNQTMPDTEKYDKGGKVDITDIVKETEKPSDDMIGKHSVMRLMMQSGMSKEDIKRFSKEYKSPKEEKIGKMAEKALKGKKK